MKTTTGQLARRTRPFFTEAKVSLRLLRQNRSATLGTILLVGLILVAILAPFIATHDPLEQNLDKRLMPPDAEYLFGGDEMGRDIFSRVIYGTRLSLMVAVMVVTLACLIGIVIGLGCGYVGGLVDHLLMRVTDMFMAFPSFLLAMALAAALTPSLYNAMIAMAISWWPDYARLVRATTLSVKENLYVEGARAAGESGLSIVFRHVLPNSLTPLMVKATMDLGVAILVAASLSFIGLGAQPPTPEWGAMIFSGRSYILGYPWVGLAPGLFIMLSIVAFNLTGDGVRDMVDPRLRSR